MVQGYYTLPEASKFLSMPVDELKLMAQKGQIRSFQDRGTLRFRVQDIQELARVRGGGSEPDMVLGEAAPAPKSGARPPSSAKRKAPGPKTPGKHEAAGAPEVFAFDMNDDDSVDLGAPLPSPGSGAKGGKVSPRPRKGPASPAPVGSDSDVRLVAGGSDVTFSVPKEAPAKPADSDVKISPDPLKPRSGVQPPSSSKRALGSAAKPKSGATPPVNHPSPRPGSGSQPPDSGVRLVPLDSDSDVKLVGASDDVPLGYAPTAPTDSNVRLDKGALPPADSSEGNLMLTDEIDLDAEIKRQEEKAKHEPSTKLKPKSELKLPTSSPFELSDSDVPMPPELRKGGGPKTPKQAKKAPSDSSDFDMAAHGGSSDFDLVPGSEGSILLEGESKDFSLEASDEQEQVLHDESTTELTSSTSGISLNNPVDAGISLEENAQSSDDVDFDLSLEVEDTPRPAKNAAIEDSGFELSSHKTPKPKKKSGEDELSSSSEFELSLEADSDGEAAALKESGDSHFELNLEGSDEGTVGSTSDSDSEFELTLDDSSNLEPLDDDAKPQVKAKGGESGDQDIFETDFEVPALDDSDDATVADSELESSDFDLALDDSELANEEESGSQVVALDEESAEVESDAAVVDDVEVEGEGSEFNELDEDVAVDEDVDVEEEAELTGKERVVVKEKLIPPAPWGVMPVIFMLPCVIIMFLVGILGFELVQSTANLKPPGPLTLAIADMFNQKVSLK